VGPVLQQALTFERTKQAALRDQLTGLPNFGQLELLSRSQSSSTAVAMSLIYIDVNCLKEINAEHGRHAGDEALNHVVACARKHIRPTDVLFRYGSDEFVVVQFETDKILAAAMASRIRQAVESESATSGLRARVKVSVGVSAMPEDGHSVESLVIAAKQRIGLAPGRRAEEQTQPPESIH
jgi:diguanylate cyclase (GGDEF)-like protein